MALRLQERKTSRDKEAFDLKGRPVLRSGLVAKDVGKHGLSSLECLAQIGEGTYGVVHKMREQTTGQLRVVKTVSRPAGWDDQQLKTEAQLLQSLDHPHILRIFSWYEDGRVLNIVMEHCAGGELLRVAKDGIQACGKMPEAWGATAIRQVLEALVYIHSKGVVHKDLKGDNLLLLESTEARNSVFGQLPHVVVCDLGLAEVCRPNLGGMPGFFRRAENVGRARRIAGTPSTMAPEVWTGIFGQKCDLWSIGAVMFELLTSTAPFRPAKNEEKLWLEAYQKGPDWSLFSRMSTEEAVDLQRKLLTVKEEKRPTAAEACQHQWLVKNRRSCLSPNDLQALTKAVRDWRGRNPMQRALCLKIAVGCTCLKKFASLFSQIDTDNSGALDSSEIVPALTKLGVCHSQAAEIAAALDVNNDGSCEYLEFAAACLSSLEAEFDELLRQEFHLLNAEGKGWLRPDELEPLLQELHSLATSHGFCLEQIDEDGDGRISFSEFCTFFGRAGVVYAEELGAQGVTELPMKQHVRILQGKREVDEFRASMDKSMQASRDSPIQAPAGNVKRLKQRSISKTSLPRSPSRSSNVAESLEARKREKRRRKKGALETGEGQNADSGAGFVPLLADFNSNATTAVMTADNSKSTGQALPSEGKLSQSLQLAAESMANEKQCLSKEQEGVRGDRGDDGVPTDAGLFQGESPRSIAEDAGDLVNIRHILRQLSQANREVSLKSTQEEGSVQAIDSMVHGTSIRSTSPNEWNTVANVPADPVPHTSVPVATCVQAASLLGEGGAPSVVTDTQAGSTSMSMSRSYTHTQCMAWGGACVGGSDLFKIFAWLGGDRNEHSETDPWPPQRGKQPAFRRILSL
mmetsp:Transcript_21847/g.49784  ORF Transcript_21847/g.49784 Transcript_21847/m.49784 type:complete len:859 (+) Transcript_21847:65-2641(+)